MPSVAPVSAGSITQLSAFDPRAMVLALQEGCLEHVQLEKGRFNGQIAHTVSSQCRTDWGRYNLALLAKGDLSSEWLSVGIFLCGNGAWRVQGQELRNGDMVLYGQGSEMCISLPPKAQWLGVQIPRLRLDCLGFRLPGATTSLHLPGVLPPDASQTLNALVNILGPQRLHTPTVAQSEQAHEQLLQVVWAELARRWCRPTASAVTANAARQRMVQAVHQWSEGCSETPLRMDALCQAMDIPIWQLERAFHQTYGVPPQRLLALHRLAAARRALLVQTASVTEVAMSHGFWHLGRFAVLYKDYFGESPSETARLTRYQ